MSGIETGPPRSLVEGIAEIARRRARSGPARALGAPRLRPRLVPPGADALELPGAELTEVDGTSVLAVRREVTDLLPGADVATDLRAALARLRALDPEEIDRGLRPARGLDLRDLVVLDLETTGFWGCPIFLVGLLLVEDGCLVTRQLLARTYPEEASILLAAAGLLARRKLLVTFNGKSYDIPCLRERSVYHRVAARTEHLAHVDVLHPARRRFRGELPDCRLQTLERLVVGIHRTGDIPSAEIPAVYHRFAATADADDLLPVLHHGRVDLVTTARLFAELIFSPRR